MYYADSDIVTIVLAIITMAAGVYSSIKKQQPENNSAGKAVADKNPDSVFFALDNLFGVEEPESNGADMKQNREESHGTNEEVIPVEIEEGIVSTSIVSSAECQISEQVEIKEGNTDLKKLLKASPKNVVLASEILNPKYKEF